MPVDRDHRGVIAEQLRTYDSRTVVLRGRPKFVPRGRTTSAAETSSADLGTVTCVLKTLIMRSSGDAIPCRRHSIAENAAATAAVIFEPSRGLTADCLGRPEQEERARLVDRPTTCRCTARQPRQVGCTAPWPIDGLSASTSFIISGAVGSKQNAPRRSR